LLSSAIRFAAGVEHQFNGKGGLRPGTPQFSQQAEAVTLGKPDIRDRDQQIEDGSAVGIRRWI